MPRPPLEDYIVECTKAPKKSRIGRVDKEEFLNICNYALVLETTIVVLSQEMNIKPEEVGKRCMSYWQERMDSSQAC